MTHHAGSTAAGAATDQCGTLTHHDDSAAPGDSGNGERIRTKPMRAGKLGVVGGKNKMLVDTPRRSWPMACNMKQLKLWVKPSSYALGAGGHAGPGVATRAMTTRPWPDSSQSDS
jgi:hypothetical protein